MLAVRRLAVSISIFWVSLVYGQDSEIVPRATDDPAAPNKSAANDAGAQPGPAIRRPWEGMLLGPKGAVETLPMPATAPLAPPPRIWCGGAEFGLNGAEGNSTNFKMRLGANAKRETDATIFKTDVTYGLATNNDTQNENRGLWNMRQEWLLPKSAWSVFWSGLMEWDEFTAYDMRLSTHGGMVYTWLKTDATLLKNRMGAGGSWEMGGTQDEFKPEALLGLDLEHLFLSRYKLCLNVDYFPDWSDFAECRVIARASLEVLIDPDLNLTLKLGVLDRYDSTPAGKRPNDLDYFAVLLWKF